MNSTIAGVLAGLVFLGPVSASATSVTPVAPVLAPSAITQDTLANGMRVVIVPNALAPVATTSITYGAGGIDDSIPGIAHATEHMLFRGTGDVSSDQFAAIATRTGAQYNAETTDLYTRFYFTVPSAYVGVALRLEADRMNGALIRQSDWTTERGAIEQEVKAHESNPLFNVGLRVAQVFYGDTPYAADTVGTIPGFDKMTAADITQFYHTWYHPNNATLVVSGDVDPAATLVEIHKLFDPIAAVAVPAHKPLVVTPLAGSTIKETVDFPIPLAALGFRLPGLRDPDYAASEVLVGALNNGRSALTDLTLQGKVLGAVASGDAFADEGMGLVFVAAHPGADPALALNDVKAVIADYVAHGVPTELIEAAKTRLLASKAYDAASIPGQAEEWSYAFAIGEHSPDAIYDALASVTPDDVNRVLRKYVVADHELALTLQAKSGVSMPHVDPHAATENVHVTATHSVPLPSWTAGYFSAPLRAPHDGVSARIARLPNGLKIVVRREAFAPVVVIKGEVRTSPELYEPRGKEGVAKITQGLLDLGTREHDYKAYQAELDTIAADVSLGTSFSENVNGQDFDRAVQLLAEAELQPAFSANMFGLVRQNLAQAYAALEHRPEMQAEIARTNARYPAGDPRRRRATARSVAAVTLDDVKRWYAFAYRPDLTTISIVGDVDPDHAIAVFKQYFGAWKANGRRPSFHFPVIDSHAKATSVTVKSTTSKQSDVTLTQEIGVHRGNPDAVALELANTVLSGEGTGSQLFRDVRSAKGYVYSIDSTIDVEKSGSTFSIDFASDAKNVNAAQAAAIASIERMRREPLPVEEVQRAKALLLSERLVQLDTYGGVADDLLIALQNGVNSNDIYRYYTLLLKTTPQQIRDAMRKWVQPQNFSRVIVEPDE